jgi:Uma2 family endonuclease
MEKRKSIMTSASPSFPPATDFHLTDAELRLTEDDLPYSEAIPMETELHLLQIFLLIETLRAWWNGRDDVYVCGDMFVYFSPQQVKKYDFRGPDVLIAQGVKKRVRKSWVTWQEGKPPDVVIELMSDSTAKFDKTVKKRIYQDRLRTPEYFLYDPVEYEFLGYSLRNGRYEPIEPDASGRLASEQLGLALQVWDGDYTKTTSRWLRWATLDGMLLPTKEERLEEERLRAEEQTLRAEEEWLRAREAEQKSKELEAELARYRERFGDVTE